MIGQAGDEQAISWLHGIVGGSNPTDGQAMAIAFDMMREADRADEAVDWLRRTAAAGGVEARRSSSTRDAAEAGAPGNALSLAAMAPAEAGHVDEMIAWLLRRAEAGDAIVVYERAAQAGDAAALERVARQLADADLFDQALVSYLRAAEAGRIHAFEHARTLLGDNGRADEAARLTRLGIAPGGAPAAEWQLSELRFG